MCLNIYRLTTSIVSSAIRSICLISSLCITYTFYTLPIAAQSAATLTLTPSVSELSHNCISKVALLVNSYIKLTQVADGTLDHLHFTRHQVENSKLAHKLENIEEQLEDQLLKTYSKLDRMIKADSPSVVFSTRLAVLDDMLSISDSFILLLKEINGQRAGVVKHMQQLKQKALARNKMNLPLLCDLAEELMLLNFQTVDNHLIELALEWEKYISRPSITFGKDDLLLFSEKLQRLAKESTDSLEVIQKRHDVFAQRQQEDNHTLSRVDQHLAFIKDKHALPLHVRGKSIEFLIDLARSKSKQDIIDLGHQQVTRLYHSLNKYSHISLWHFHLKRGQHDYVIIWAVNKLDERKTFYPLWVGHHGKAPYNHEKSYIKWIKGKFPYIDRD